MFTRLITALLFLLPLSSFAHGYWFEVEGSHKTNEQATIKLFFGEYVSGERLNGNYLDKMKDIQVFVKTPGGEKQSISMKQLNGYWEGFFIPKAEGTYEVIGINDQREVQDWTKHSLGIVRPVQYLKTIYQAGTKTTAPTHTSFIDIAMQTVSPGKQEITVYKSDSAFAKAKITLTHPDGWEKILTTDKNGKATFTVPASAIYLIAVEWIDTTPGQFKGKAYETVRHRMDYTL